MREVPAAHGRPIAVLIALACGCGSAIQREPRATPDELSGAAGGAAEPSPASGGEPAPRPGPGMPRSQPTSPAAAAATLLWFEDFETGAYDRWTSNGYGADWGDDCQRTGFSVETAMSPSTSQRSEITCPYRDDDVHRGYGGLQFEGDRVLPAYTNRGTGIDAPHGIVNTSWIRLDSPSVFENGKWLSLFTVSGSCDYSDAVLTLGIEDRSGRLAAAHYQAGGGTRTFEPDAPGLPRGEWVRVTVYVNYHAGEMHVWQNGRSIQHVTFTRPQRTLCHFHWGLYASADNDDIVLYEDDKAIWKLAEPWTDFSVEPCFDGDGSRCR